MKKILACVMALMSVSSLSLAGVIAADTIDGFGLDRGDVKSDVIFPVYGQYNVHMGYLHDFSGGNGLLSGYNGNGIITFCGDLQNTLYTHTTFMLAEVTDGPNGGWPNYGPYSMAQADRLNAWMTASYQLGLVDNRGYYINTSHTIGSTLYSADDVARAIQFGVWDSLFESNGGTSWLYNEGGLRLANPSMDVIGAIGGISDLADDKFGAPTITKLIVANGDQDMVILAVPDSGSTFTLLGVALLGIAVMRRQRNANHAL